MLIRTDTLQPWRGEPVADLRLPSNAESLWTDGELAAVNLVRCKPFIIPKGKQTVTGGEPTYAEDGTETYPVEDAPITRPSVFKGTVQDRIIEAGKVDDAYAALTANPTLFARWYAPNWPFVYCDDPDAVALVKALGLDPAVILAPEGV